MPDDATRRRRASLGAMTGAAWLMTIIFGVALPAVLFFYALATGGPIESTGPRSAELTGVSLLLFLGARLISTATTVVVVIVCVLARRHGFGALLIWIPGLISAAVALLLGDIRLG